MTVSNKPPVAEYNGNGSITQFAWDWDMVGDSSINVMVNNENVSNWTLQGNTVVFSVAPADGDEIIIYRRTLIRQPEDYQAFGRFHSEKTELTMDRNILIAQELAGNRDNFNAPAGIVGGANLSITRGEYDITVNSERGSDAVLDMWDPDGDVVTPGDPHASIIWAGANIEGGQYSLPGNTNGISAILRFRMDTINGVPGQGDAYYNDFNGFVYVSWVNLDPNDDEYWMRVTETGVANPKVVISDGDNNRSFGEEFLIRGSTANNLFGPYITVYTFGDAAPSTRTSTFTVEICKDVDGVPDGNWATRNVKLEAIFNA